MLSTKEAVTSGTIVIGTRFLISKPFCVLVDLVTTHSFISTRYVMQLNLENKERETNHRIKLPNDSRVECTISYKLVLITSGEIVL